MMHRILPYKEAGAHIDGLLLVREGLLRASPFSFFVFAYCSKSKLNTNVKRATVSTIPITMK